MTLHDDEAAVAIAILTLPDPAEEIAVTHAGRRYGGFRCEAHARWFVRRMGWDGEAVVVVGLRQEGHT